MDAYGGQVQKQQPTNIGITPYCLCGVIQRSTTTMFMFFRQNIHGSSLKYGKWVYLLPELAILAKVKSNADPDWVAIVDILAKSMVLMLPFFEQIGLPSLPDTWVMPDARRYFMFLLRVHSHVLVTFRFWASCSFKGCVAACAFFSKVFIRHAAQFTATSAYNVRPYGTAAMLIDLYAVTFRWRQDGEIRSPAWVWGVRTCRCYAAAALADSNSQHGK